jgi:pimeloyl-ACP methyl ester carboxylesterase
MTDGEPRSGGTSMGGIDYVETGSGPTVLLVPGAYNTHAAWRQIQRLLVPAYRMVGTSLWLWSNLGDPKTR